MHSPTAELERCFRAGAAGLKIAKELGLVYRNKDGSYIQADDPRLARTLALLTEHVAGIAHLGGYAKPLSPAALGAPSP